jgi:hypothetical protein
MYLDQTENEKGAGISPGAFLAFGGWKVFLRIAEHSQRAVTQPADLPVQRVAA